MIGNLKVFLGAQAFNDYASFLRTFGEPVLLYSTVLRWSCISAPPTNSLA